MRLLFSVMALAGLLATAGCSKEDNNCEDCVLLGYNQTQCADPWGYGDDGSNTAVEYALRDFFASNGIAINTVTISGNTQPVTNCTACACPTGKTIFALVEKEDSAAFTKVGFF